MATFNKILIVGYLGRDPETRYAPSGDAVCTFSVATTEKKKDGGDETTWFRVTTWRRQAEVAQQYLTKGKQVYLEGRLRTNEYTDREGNKRTSLEVNCTDMQFLGSRGDEDTSDKRPTPTARAPVAAGVPGLHVTEEVDENDIPF